MMRNIDMIRQVSEAARGRWPDVLSLMGIEVPTSPRAQVACPACGGKDRFRFDDDGRGAHFCNACGAGDGLELVKKVNSCDATQAAQLVADALGLDVQTLHRPTGKEVSLLAQRRAEREQRQAVERQGMAARFAASLDKLTAQVLPGEPAYLTARGLVGFVFPVLPDGSLMMSLTGNAGTTTAVQIIAPDGGKRLISGSEIGRAHV